MPKLQHQTRRDGIILVGGAKYALDAKGCVEVSKEHAELLLQGAKWKPEGVWQDWQRAVTSSTPPIVAGARRARTRAELLGVADAEGVAGAAAALENEAATTADEDDDEEEIVVSMDMTKAQLVEVAEQLELDVSSLTKAQIIEAIEEASQ